jgi:hypothetical protein
MVWATYRATTIIRNVAIGALMRYALIRQTAPTEEQQQYVPKGKRNRWIVGGLFARIGKLIDKGADFLLTIEWIRGTERSKRYRAVQAIPRRISKGNRKKVSSMAAAMALVAVIVMESRAVPKHSNETSFDTQVNSRNQNNQGFPRITHDQHHDGNDTMEMVGP